MSAADHTATAPALAAETPRPTDVAAALRIHRDTLIIAAIITMLAVILRLDPEGRVVVPHFERYPLPAACLSRTLLHVDCPGCGLTRSFVAVAHGDFAQAFALHRLGPLLFLLVFLQVPFRAYAILRGLPPERLFRWPYWRWGPTVIVVALLLSWGYNILTGAVFH